MWWFIIASYLYAGFVGFLASKKEWRQMDPPGKLVILVLFLLLWPLYPVAFALDDN